jgi:hypothetical protein
MGKIPKLGTGEAITIGVTGYLPSLNKLSQTQKAFPYNISFWLSARRMIFNELFLGNFLRLLQQKNNPNKNANTKYLHCY